MKKTLIALSLATSLFVGNAIADAEQDAATTLARAAPAPGTYASTAGVVSVFKPATTVLASYGVNAVAFESEERAKNFAALSRVNVRTIIDTNRAYVVMLSGGLSSVKGKKESMSLPSALQAYNELGVLYIGFSDRSKAEKFCIAAAVSKSFIVKTADSVWAVRISQALAA
jgi:hypothetical protein